VRAQTANASAARPFPAANRTATGGALVSTEN
jgi:hypothetical protein